MKSNTRSLFSRWFHLCPVRHCLSLLGLLWLGVFFLLRRLGWGLTALYRHVTHPLHQLLGWVTGVVSWSVAEVLIVLFALGVLLFLVCEILRMVRTRCLWKNLYRLVLTLGMIAALVYGGFCLLWGVYYEVSSFSAESGIQRNLVRTEDLTTVTTYFANLASQYGAQVARDDSGCFAEDLGPIFDTAPQLYLEAEAQFPCLSGAALRPKAFRFSKILSYLNFTGFFFPFTAEANINVDSPACLVPATIAHELAHQRGVAAEDEANFVAVLASLSHGDPVYCYSAALLAYIHLGNALYQADRDAWSTVYQSLSTQVRADLSANNAYWDQFETPVSTVSDTVYTGFLQFYGQTQGLKTYGACVDLLVSYYLPMAS